MIKESIHQEDIMILSMYAPNIRILKYMKLKEVDKSTTIVGDFYTLLSATDKTTRQ